MARDRKRAKQRRDRARRTAGTTAVSPRARRDQEAPRDEAPREEAPREAEATPEAAPETADFTDEHVPLSLEHASADVDIAEAQLAAGYADAGPFDGQEDDGFIAPDELDDEADRVAGPQQGGRRPDGAAVPARREHHVPGNRVIGFLQASWRELQRVQWPDRRQVAQATGVVLVFCLIAGAFLGLADEVAARLVDALL